MDPADASANAVHVIVDNFASPWHEHIVTTGQVLVFLIAALLCVNVALLVRKVLP